MIVAMIVGSVAAAAAGLRRSARRATGIAMVGALPGSLPALSAPDLSPEAIRNTLPVALAVTILALTEAVSIARAIAVKSGQRIDGNQEFIGQGLSNIAGSFFSAYASQRLLQPQRGQLRGGRPHAAGGGVLGAAAGRRSLFAVAPLIAHLPLAVMAAILFLVAYGLVDFALHRAACSAPAARKRRSWRSRSCAALFADLEFAIYTGVLLSLMLYLTRTSRPLVLDVKPDPAPDSYHYTADSGLPDCPQLKMLRVNGSLFFGAVDHVQRHLEQIDEIESARRSTC